MTSANDRPRASPSVTVATTSVISITMSEFEAKASSGPTRLSGQTVSFGSNSCGATICTTVAAISSSAGSRAVSRLVHNPGSRSSGRSFAFRLAGGRAGTDATNRAYTGPASTSAGIAMIVP